MSSAISQLSCFSSINRRLHFRTHLHPCSTLPRQVAVVSNDGRGTDLSNLENRTTLSYTGDASQSHNGSSSNSNLKSEELVPGKEMNGSVQDNSVGLSKKTAKIHDFCFGIPFGGLVFTGGIVGFIFSRNPSTLSNGVLFGGALLAFSTISLRVWRQGKSSLPFILGQAVLAAVLLWKNMQTFYLTRKVFPTGFYAAISATMFCFYSYVVLSGGNPPPKKLKVSIAGAS
ncbi:PREDICTED: protein FATTY ACID EXPORT 1, chloroplastic-like [Nicotiana attenuata]|uniref:Protein fatty acid export 1, chloroplastic n=1 Tax=Nicotiana attenuata TaxID=49451 RepID=A0A314KV36_NICAT|nr:PREDICTED: protein FATTY ACID EXPORT 1, chloroplastic-like [Nicotiana attenuata]OIT33230.1 protein fatty acid export 1, chloroplastic [Nicotiana attenuata]